MLCVGGVAGLAVLLTAVAWQSQRHASALDARSDAAANASGRVLVNLLNAETGQRGFLLTGRTVYLQPYRIGAGAVIEDLATLTRLSRTVRPLVVDVAALRSLMQSNLSELEVPIALARAGDRGRALAVIDTGTDRHIMVLARARVADIERVAGRLPVAADRAAGVAQELALTVDAVLLALAFAAWRRAVGIGARRERDRALVHLAGGVRLERALREVATAAATEMDERELAGLVAARVGALLDATTAAVIRADVESLQIIGYRGPSPYPERLGWEEHSSSAQAVRTGSPARLEKYEPPASGGVGAFIAAQGLRCGISVPVRMQGRVWGAITVTTGREDGFTREEEEWLRRFADLTAAALGSGHAQARLRHEARVQNALREVAAASASGRLDERALGQLVCEHVADLLGVAASAVWRFDQGWTTRLGSHGSVDIPDRIPAREPSVAERVRSSGAPARIEDFAALDGGFARRIAERDAVSCAVGVPIIVDGSPWGALTVGSVEAQPDPDMENLLGGFAELVSAALANAQARERLRFRARLEQALREVASASASGDIDERALAGLVADRVAGLLDSPLAAVVRFAGGDIAVLGSSDLARLAPDDRIDEHSAVGRVAQTQATVVIEDYHGFAPENEELAHGNGGRGAVAVPVFVGGGVWGSLSAVLRPNAATAAAVELLEQLAQLISAALANTQAQAKLREEARLERAMRTVANAGAQGNLDEPGLAGLAAAQIANLLGSPLAAVMRFDGPARSTVLGHAGPFPFPAELAAEDQATVAAIVANTAMAARIDDYTAVRGPFAALAVEHGIAGAIAVPIRVNDVVWGCLGAMTDRHGGFVPGTEALLERFATVVSVALANVRSLRALRHEAKLEQALREVSTASAGGELGAHDLFALVAARIAEVLDAPAAMVVHVQDGIGTPVGVYGLTRLPETLLVRESAAASVALATGRAARVNDYASLKDRTHALRTAAAAGHRSAVAAPVLLHGLPWGYLAVAKPDAHSFATETESVLERFAGLIAVALAQADTLATLQREATTDGLTGLLNHRAFQQRLHEEFARAERHGRPLSLITFDLDGFKLVNDLHGHSAGDNVLHTVGRVLEHERRANDIPARVGGDEFALIAPDTSSADALTLAERLRTSITAALRDLDHPLTLSAGVTDLTGATTTHDLVHLADNALYHAKHHGRDRTVRYTPNIDQTRGQASDGQRRALGGLTALARAVDAKDSPTQRHSERVATISTELAVRLGWSPERCARLREAALVHDVGKIGVPDTILTKPGTLTDDEYERIKSHAHLGAQIAEGVLDPEQVTWLRGHHERPDGRGYPDALTAETIPDGARLLAIADAYDTMTTGRPYKPAITPAQATQEMRRHAGRQFDADLLDLLDQWALANNTINTPDLTHTTLDRVAKRSDATDPTRAPSNGRCSVNSVAALNAFGDQPG